MELKNKKTLKKKYKPNLKTLKSFEDAKNNVKLATCKDIEEFWKDINEEFDK